MINKEKYLISIIIPVYNVEKYLENTIKSIEEQTIGLEKLEVILVDDNSKDESKKIIKKYVDKYENFKGIYCQESSGFPGRPRNIGLDICSSEFIIFLDSDDYLERNACEILYNKIIETDADIVCGGHTIFDSHSKETFDIHLWICTLTNPYDTWNNRVNTTKKILSNSNFELIVDDLYEHPSIIGAFNVWSKIFKKSLINNNKIRFPEDRVAQDSVFLLESFYNANRIAFIKDIIVHYNNIRNDANDSSISHVKNQKNLEGRLSAYLLMYNISVKHNHVDLFAKYLLSKKLNYWLSSHLLTMKLDDYSLNDSFLYNLFYNYQVLFKLAFYYNINLSPEKYEIYKDICNNDFDKAVEKVKLLM